MKMLVMMVEVFMTWTMLLMIFSFITFQYWEWIIGLGMEYRAINWGGGVGGGIFC